MSMGAAWRGERAGPRPRPLPAGGGDPEGLKGTWAEACATSRDTQAKACATALFNRVTGIVAPAKSVGFPVQGFQSSPVIGCRAGGIDRYFHFIANLERVALDSLLT